MATVEGNTIHIQSSRVKRIKLYISADMFNINQQINLVINNKKYLNFKLDQNKNTIVEEFMKTKDRTFIVSNIIELTVN